MWTMNGNRPSQLTVWGIFMFSIRNTEGCPVVPACYSPTMILQISSDHGQTWASPTVIYPAGSNAYQVDAQIVVDRVDGQTVYAAWLQNNKSDIVVAKSTDFGATWSVVTADHTNAGTDKPILRFEGRMSMFRITIARPLMSLLPMMAAPLSQKSK